MVLPASGDEYRNLLLIMLALVKLIEFLILIFFLLLFLTGVYPFPLLVSYLLP